MGPSDPRHGLTPAAFEARVLGFLGLGSSSACRPSRKTWTTTGSRTTARCWARPTSSTWPPTFRSWWSARSAWGYCCGPAVSGHTLKHLAAGMGAD